MSELDPQIVAEIANIANKSCSDKLGLPPSVRAESWHVEAVRDEWRAWTDNVAREPACEYEIYISMSNKRPDSLGCLVCVTAG